MDSARFARSHTPGSTGRWLAPRPAGAPMPIAVGTMNFGGRTNKADSLRILARALDLGLDFFDTANAYGDGVSETITGEGLRAHRDQVMIATKVGWRRIKGQGEGLSKEVIRKACDESLKNLGIDRIDLYYLHVPDKNVSYDETLDALEGLLDVGKIGAWGVSNHASWQILELATRAVARKMPPPIHSQVIYNLLIRQLDIEYFAYAKAHPIHTTIYNPLAAGLLAGPRRNVDDAPPKGSRFDGNTMYKRRYWSKHFLDLAGQYADLAQKHGRTPLELAYGFVAQHPSIDSVLVGPSTLAHLDTAVAAIANPISPELREAVDEVHIAALGTDAVYAR